MWTPSFWNAFRILVFVRLLAAFNTSPTHDCDEGECAHKTIPFVTDLSVSPLQFTTTGSHFICSATDKASKRGSGLLPMPFEVGPMSFCMYPSCCSPDLSIHQTRCVLLSDCSRDLQESRVPDQIRVLSEMGVLGRPMRPRCSQHILRMSLLPRSRRLCSC